MTRCFDARYVPELGISGVCRFVARKSHALALIVAELSRDREFQAGSVFCTIFLRTPCSITLTL